MPLSVMVMSVMLHTIGVLACPPNAVELKGKLEKQKQATSPRKTKEFLRQQAERVDFKGQDEARRRVEAKRRKERKEEWDVMEFLNGEV